MNTAKHNRTGTRTVLVVCVVAAVLGLTATALAETPGAGGPTNPIVTLAPFSGGAPIAQPTVSDSNVQFLASRSMLGGSHPVRYKWRTSVSFFDGLTWESCNAGVPVCSGLGGLVLSKDKLSFKVHLGGGQVVTELFRSYMATDTSLAVGLTQDRTPFSMLVPVRASNTFRDALGDNSRYVYLESTGVFVDDPRLLVPASGGMK